jgi:hypothetical protein
MSTTAASRPLTLPAASRKALVPQITVASVLTLCIVVYFWVESRYSSLLRKLHNGKGIHVAALSFEALVPVTPQMSVASHRTYGRELDVDQPHRHDLRSVLRGRHAHPVADAAEVALQDRSSECARGCGMRNASGCMRELRRAYRTKPVPGRRRFRYALATMISSPTLNVVVLAMLSRCFLSQSSC